jgi:hypothetical protein
LGCVWVVCEVDQQVCIAIDETGLWHGVSGGRLIVAVLWAGQTLCWILWASIAGATG